jgi:hypothetical protein
MINYGMNMTIKFAHEKYEEYFDVANIEYYDAILGTPFLRKLGVTLDFSIPGTVQIGDENIPIGKTSFNDESLKEGQQPKVSNISTRLQPTLAK